MKRTDAPLARSNRRSFGSLPSTADSTSNRLIREIRRRRQSLLSNPLMSAGAERRMQAIGGGPLRLGSSEPANSADLRLSDVINPIPETPLDTYVSR